MRQIGSLANETKAERFVDYLKTIEVSAQTEEDDGSWLIWVKDENQLDVAREELQKFEADPEADHYRNAQRQAYEIRSEEVKRRVQANKNVRKVRNDWSAPLSKRAPIVLGLIVSCVGLAVFGGGFGEKTAVDRYLMFVDFGSDEYLATGDTFTSIKQGQVWRVMTPAFLHGNLPHLIFNLYWIYFLGSQIEPRVGRWRFTRLVLAGAIAPNLLQAILVGPNFLGISGVVFALFGFMVVRRKDGYVLSQFTIAIIFVFFILDFTPFALTQNVAVWAHAGGLATGLLIGYLPELMSDST